MKSRLFRRMLWNATLACGVGALLLSTASPPGPQMREREPGFDAPDAAAQTQWARRRPLAGGIDTVALYDRAAARVQRMARFSSRIGRILPDALEPARVWRAGHQIVPLDGSSRLGILDAWTPLGPGNIGGRTRVVRFHPTRHETLFAAGVSGGIWRSDDAGASWRPLADGLVNIAVNALIIDPNNTERMYAGTGEGYFREEIRGTGLPLRGGGIFASRDGGARWERLAATATPDFHWVNDLELGIGDTQRLYAATRTGVWRSTDAGETWTRLLETTVRGGCLDLALRPDRPDDVLFASCGSYEQATVYRFNRASTSGDVEVVLQEPGMGRTSLAIAPSAPDVIYALSASNDPGPGGNYRQALLAVYRSDRGGAAGSWQARVTNTDPVRLHTLLLTNASPANIIECIPTARNSYTNMGWYVNVIAVDPRDSDRVWAAGVDWFRSDDGGRTWGLASAQAGPTQGGPSAQMHVDQHGIAFHPAYDGQNNQVAIVGNDGGVYRTENARARTATGPRATCSPSTSEVRWQNLNRGYGVTQFYYGLPFPDGTQYFGGAQDNGTLLGGDTSGGDGWRPIFGGDGAYVAVQPDNTQILYAESQWANIAKSLDGGVRWTSSTRGLDAVRSDVLGPDANYLFVAPFVMDPGNSRRLWLGGEYLYKTVDAAALWTKVSTAMPDGGVVSTIAIAAADSNHVVVGTHKGDVVWSRRALDATSSTEWEHSRPRDGWVTSVAIDPRNNEVVYATYGNFGGAHIFRSTNGGSTWTSLDGTGDGALPDIPVHSLVVDPDDSSRLYIGTDLGVMVSIDGGGRWLVEETGFGPAVTEWLALTRDGAGIKRLFAFTHGRGAWRVDLR